MTQADFYQGQRELVMAIKQGGGRIATNPS